MCLVYNEKNTKLYRRRRTPFYAYKIWYFYRGELYNKFKSGKPKFSPSGILKSDRKSLDLLEEEKSPWLYNTYEIGKGIHCYLKYPPAYACNSSYYNVEKVLCDPKDIIGVNGDKSQIVLMKIKIEKELLEKYPKNVVKKRVIVKK